MTLDDGHEPHELSEASAAGVELWTEGDRLRFRAPPGALTDALRRSLRERRAEIVEALRSRAGDRVEEGPLAANQRGLWLLHQLVPDSPAYNVGAAVRIHGPLDAEKLAEAFQILVDRHEALRTAYRSDASGEPTRSTRGFVPFELSTRDATGWEAAELREAVDMAYAKPFQLDRAPLVRAVLFREGPDRHVLVFSAHHLAVDGQSFFLVFEELIAVYSALARGEPVPPAAAAAQFGEFVEWQRGMLGNSPELSEYWQGVLTPPPAKLEIPADRPRRGVPRLVGGTVHGTLDAGVAAALADTSKDSGTTAYVTLLALWSVFLHRLTGETDVTVGTPVHGRSSSRFERTVGDLVNMIPLRSRITSEMRMREAVEQAREIVISGMGRQEYPLPLMTEDREGTHDAGAPFQTLFVYQDFKRFGDLFRLLLSEPGDVSTFGALRLEIVPLDQQEGQFDLALEVTPRDDVLTCSLKYDSDLFERETAERRLDEFLTMVRDAAARPDAVVSDLAIVPPAERRRLAEWEGPERAYEEGVTLQGLVEAQVRRTPDAVAVEASEHGSAGALTYGDLGRRADALAERLQGLGVGRDVPVAVSMERSADLMVALLGVLKAGGAYVPVDPGYPGDRQAFMLEDSGARVLLTEGALVGSVRVPETTEVVALDELWDALAAGGAPEERTDAEGLAYVIYTSGSTGRPKGAMIEHRSIANRLQWMQEHFGLEPTDVVLQKTPYSFDVSVWELFWPLMTGARLVMAAPEGHKDPRYLAEAIRERGVTTLHFVPSMLSVFLEEPGLESLASVRRVICSGEALGPALRDRFFERMGEGVELTNLYGPTEAAVDVSWWRCSRTDPAGSVPIGRPVANTRLYVLDERQRLLPIGAVGELCIGGVQVGRGYLNRPELTAERFVADPFQDGGTLYRTGDLARWRPDGALDYLGRLDLQVKVRGFRIELGEIETRLADHPDVQDAVVVAHGDELVAYVVASDEATSPTVDALRTWAAETLPEYMVPSLFVPLETLPLTPSGKVDRKRLPEPTASRRPARERVAPRDAREEVIAEIWSEVLGDEAVGVHEDFFELGGHSLTAARVVARIRSVLGAEVPLVRFFEHPTVAETAEWISGHEGAERRLPPIVPRAPNEATPLSFTQERLWFLQQLAPESTAYNLSFALILEGDLDAERLTRAVGGVVARHEVLRTRLRTVRGRPEQVVLPEAGCDEWVEKLPGATQAEALDRISEYVERPYDLAEDPPLRVALLELDTGEHALGIGMHHAASDQWSLGVLSREISRLYNEGEAALEALPIQYGDYAVWQREHLSEAALGDDLSYWAERLDGLTTLDVPTDRPRPRVVTSEGGYVEQALAPELEAGIRALAVSERATPFAPLMAAFNALLQAYSRQSDIAVGVPVATRPDPALEGLIGTFLNTLVHRNDVSGEPSFRELVARVWATAKGALAHQDVPFEVLVQELEPERDTSRPPLFQVLFNVANAPVQLPELDGLTSELASLARSSAQFELGLHVHQGLVRLEYNSSLFERETAERLLSQYVTILERGVAEPGLPLPDLVAPFAADAQRLAEWEGPERAYEEGVTLQGLVEAQVRRTPDAVAVEASEHGSAGALTYGDLGRRADALAERLQGLGVGRDVPVAVSMERSADLMVALLGVLKAGGAYVPVDPGYPGDRQAFMLEDSGARVLLTEGALVGSVRVPETTEVVALDELWDALAAGGAPEERTDAEGLAYVIYTSGSTGRPKGAMIEHRSIANRLQWMQEHFGLEPTDVVLQKTPYSFDVSVWELFWPLMTGARLVMAAPEGHKDPRYLAEAIRERGVTTLHFVPSMLSVFLEEPGLESLASVRRVICSGEALGPALRDRFFERMGEGVELTNLYGPTEAAVDVSWWRCSRTDPAGSVPIGRPVANTRLYVLDERQRLLPIGAVGELCIGGVQVGRGYLNRPELTAERFVADPFQDGGTLYRTGDLARWRPDGALDYLGRLDLQVKVRGFRIELGEIETRLADHPDVQDAVVVAWQDRLVAYLVYGLDTPSVGQLRTWAAETLPEYMVPSLFVPLETLPLTPSGKVDRKRLPEPGATAPDPTLFEEPTLPSQRLLAEIWSELLSVERVGLSDNFFELGGHSLLAMEVVARVEERIGHRMEPRSLFFKTLAQLAESLPEDSGPDGHTQPE